MASPVLPLLPTILRNGRFQKGKLQKRESLFLIKGIRVEASSFHLHHVVHSADGPWAFTPAVWAVLPSYT